MPISVDWNELVGAFEFVGLGGPHEHEAILCRKSGKLLWLTDVDEDVEAWPDDADDSEKYLAIPHKKELGLGKPLALEFARAFLPDQFNEVRRIFENRGAFRGSRICCSETRRRISRMISRTRRKKPR